MYACIHFMFMCTYIIFSISTLIVQQEFFHLQSILIQTLRLNYTVDVYTPEICTTSCTSVSHAGRAKHDSHRQPGNQLQFSWGRGLATGEWQHARQPHGQAVIIWFTHNQLLIVSHWSAGTCNLEQNMRAFGGRALIMKGMPALLCAWPLVVLCWRLGIQIFVLWQFDWQLTWPALELPVNTIILKVAPVQVSSAQKKLQKIFFPIYSIAVFCQSDQHHVATVSSGLWKFAVWNYSSQSLPEEKLCHCFAAI